jgi:methionyl-tRNA synthetase
MAEKFFITTAIDYTNGAPHIGHAYEKVLADVLARYHRLKGDDVFFLTGVDQHGQKVQQSAEKAGVEAQEYVDGITAKFVALWKKLGVEYTGWAATTEAVHKECVRANLQMLWDDKVPGTDRSRWLYKKTQRGFYSVRQEQFLTDKERGPDGEFGPEWQPVEERDEENFYFRLTAHDDLGFDPKEWLLDLIGKRHPELLKQDSQDGGANPVHPANPVSTAARPFVIPAFRASELYNAVKKLEGDLCISRPASRLKWGIPFPESFGAGFVTYVWFDALVNYITYAPGHDPHFGGNDEGMTKDEGANSSSVIRHSSFKDWWPPLHVIGKDILIPAHGVYWPIMLKALGFSDAEMPALLVHGWWNIAGAKMSKSIGNIVDPDALADKYGAEAVRYYLMSDITTGRDADFSEERLIQKYNVDLANSLGNLLNRTLNMAWKYREGNLVTKTWAALEKSGPAAEAEGNAVAKHLSDHRVVAKEVTKSYFNRMDNALIHAAIEAAGLLAQASNLFVEESAPWKLAKDQTDSGKAHLDAVLYTLAESLRIIAILISPVLPDAARGIFAQLGWDQEFRLADAVWGGLPDGHQLGKPVPLFPRIETPKA